MLFPASANRSCPSEVRALPGPTAAGAWASVVVHVLSDMLYRQNVVVPPPRKAYTAPLAYARPLPPPVPRAAGAEVNVVQLFVEMVYFAKMGVPSPRNT